MKRIIVAVALALAATAFADPAPRGPDFAAQLPYVGVDRSLAVSDATAPIAPSDTLTFAPGSAQLDADSVALVGTAAHWLRAHPHYAIAVEGHAPGQGERLAGDRARAVRDRLTASGVATDRIVVLISNTRDDDVVLFADRVPANRLASDAIRYRPGVRDARWTEVGSALELRARDHAVIAGR
ncbi:MAG TPA: OmpA family protein [Kofleriaceae bacterium]|nr:OmpA family protein [Kofleriaceae bacterium]